MKSNVTKVEVISVLTDSLKRNDKALDTVDLFLNQYKDALKYNEEDELAFSYVQDFEFIKCVLLYIDNEFSSLLRKVDDYFE